MPRIYAETPRVRARQVVADLATAAWVVLWVVVGLQVYDLVMVLAVPGDQLSEVGTSLATGAGRVGDALEGTPLVGGGLAAPFGALAEAGRDLGDVGEATRRAAHRLGLWLAVVSAGCRSRSSDPMRDLQDRPEVLAALELAELGVLTPR